MKTIGVYLHIPFCKFLCHYCDFVKTAHWDDELVERYFDALQKHCKAWIDGFLIPQGYQISSVFVGGGTKIRGSVEGTPLPKKNEHEEGVNQASAKVNKRSNAVKRASMPTSIQARRKQPSKQANKTTSKQ